MLNNGLLFFNALRGSVIKAGSEKKLILSGFFFIMKTDYAGWKTLLLTGLVLSGFLSNIL